MFRFVLNFIYIEPSNSFIMAIIQFILLALVVNFIILIEISMILFELTFSVNSQNSFEHFDFDFELH